MFILASGDQGVGITKNFALGILSVIDPLMTLQAIYLSRLVIEIVVWKIMCCLLRFFKTTNGDINTARPTKDSIHQVEKVNIYRWLKTTMPMTFHPFCQRALVISSHITNGEVNICIKLTADDFKTNKTVSSLFKTSYLLTNKSPFTIYKKIGPIMLKLLAMNSENKKQEREKVHSNHLQTILAS